jgi:DNA-directed RNA polymerase specialized sigma24 family protein
MLLLQNNTIIKKSDTFDSVLQEEEQEIISIKERVNSICEKHGLEDAELLYLIRKSGSVNQFPIEILSQNLSPLEAVVSYLKTNKGLKYCKIAKLLNRDERTVWVTFENAKKKQKNLVVPQKSIAQIPLSIVRNRQLSILELASVFLKEKKGLTLTKISSILKKDTSTIWTAISRANKKLLRTGGAK